MNRLYSYTIAIFERTVSARRIAICLIALYFGLGANQALAQFQEPEFEKITGDRREWFMEKFKDIKWTGRGLYNETRLESIKTEEIRARLQTVFGEPTKKLEDLIHNDDFSARQAIQFEYWFTVDDSIPMMVLDVDGPFTSGLVFGGASKYIDLMPQIKRTFAQKLLKQESLDSFEDYYYSPEREQWYLVSYKNGEYQTKEISTPDGMEIDF